MLVAAISGHTFRQKITNGKHPAVNNKMDKQTWDTFKQIVNDRRAIRHFTDEDISDDDIKAILSAAQLAPSSSNAQPYEFHWIKDKSLCQEMAKVCNNQEAPAYIVIVATYKNLAETFHDMKTHANNSGLYSEDEKKYVEKKVKEVNIFRKIFPLKIWELFYELLSFISPHFVIAPIGQIGLLHWSIKSSIFAAQTIMLAASARGFDSCPMEGFNAFKVAKILKLKRGYIVPLVIALGKRDTEHHLHPRWRQSFDKIVKIH